MKKYGHRIIEALFKKREERTAICAELVSRREANRDLRDIRVFEIGLSPEQFGDYQQGSGAAAQEEEGLRLIAIAKKQGLFIDKSTWENFGDRKRLPSGESIVFLKNNGRSVVKLRNPFAKSVIKRLYARDALYEHVIHNILFPNTYYRFMGITQDAGGVRFVLTQKYFADTYGIPTQEEIDRYLIAGLGLKPEERYYYGNEYLAVTDVSADSDNVLTDGKCLYFIDPIIRFKKPALMVYNHYYFELLK